MAASKTNRDRFQTLQNKALRIAMGVDRRYDTDQLHKDSNLLKLKYRREQHLLQFMFNKRDGGDPSFRRVSKRKGVSTRASSKCNFILRKPNTEKFKKSVSYLGPKKWNLLSADTQKLGCKLLFKNAVACMLKRRSHTPHM